MQQLIREGPDYYFDIVGDAFCQDTRWDQTLKFITLLEKTLGNPDTEILLYTKKGLQFVGAVSG